MFKKDSIGVLRKGKEKERERNREGN